VKLVVVPPPLTSDALAAGGIDGFCVGAPWNMVASERGVGRIVAVKQDIWPSAPEKVIGMRPDWAASHPDTVFRLLVALDAAARWCDRVENHDALAAVLAEQRYLGTPVAIIRRVLSGEFSLDHQGERRVIPHYFTFHAGFANYPRPSQALWTYSQMLRWGQVAWSAGLAERAVSAYRPDLYRMALGTGPDDDDLRREGTTSDDRFMDDTVFDPADISAYVERFSVRHILGVQSQIDED
jgi:hypothetical protein